MPRQSTRIALALGGNIGDVPRRFDEAIRLLSSRLTHIKRASIIRTAPVNCVPGTPDFHNSAFIAEFDGTPEELLALCQQTEQTLGRPREHSSRESRTVDIDLLLYGEETFSSPQLTLPHPRLKERLFVLHPLAEIAPDWRVPPEMHTVRELLAQLLQSSGEEQISR